MKKMQRMLAAFLTLVLVLSLTACGSALEPLALTVSLPQELTTLDPAMATTATEKTVVNHLYENLMKLTADAEGNVQLSNGVASHYQYENNPDGTQTWTFSLRGNAVWADGRQVTADDFVYAWRRLADPATDSPNAYVLDMVAGYAEARKSGDMTKLQVSAADRYTLVVVLSSNCLQFLQQVCAETATMPVREDAAAMENWSMAASTLLTNGAYCHVESWENGVLTVTSDEEYYDARRLGPQRLSFSFGAASADADFVLTHEGVEEAEGWNLGSLPYTGTLVINQMSTISQEMRQTLSMVIDRQQISDLLGSVYEPADGLIPGGVRSTQGGVFRAGGALIDNDPEQYAARCEAARALIRGQTMPEEGNVSLAYVSDGATDQVAKALQQTWRKELGVNVTLQSMELEEMTDSLRKGDFTMARVMLSCQRSDAVYMLEDWTSGAAGNYANIHSEAYDLLIRISHASSSVEARDAYLEDAERLLLESGYVVPVCHMTDGWKLNETLQGVLGDGLGQYYFHSVKKVEK